MAFPALFNPGSHASSTSLGLLVLRLWAGLSMVGLHGWSKLANFGERSQQFPDILGIGSTGNLALVVLAEVVAALLVAVGLGTRAAAFVLSINMAVAWLYGHGGKLSGPGNGELAFLFLGVFVALLFTGAGRFSLDAAFGKRR